MQIFINKLGSHQNKGAIQGLQICPEMLFICGSFDHVVYGIHAK